MAGSDLDSYLQEQAEDGVAKRPGAFSVNLDQARLKMADFQLPREEAWSLFLLQAAVAWECSELEIYQTRYASRFHFGFSAGRLPDRQAFELELAQVDDGQHPAIQLIVRAVQVLLGRDGASVRFCWFESEAGRVDHCALGPVTRWDRYTTPKSSTLVLEVGYDRQPTAQELLPYLPVRRKQLAMREELEEYCGPFPLRLSLDKVPFEGPLVYEKDKQQIVPCSITKLESPDTTLLDLPLPWSIGSSQKAPVAKGFYSMALSISPQIDKQPRSYLCWVKHGVLIDRWLLTFRSNLLSICLFVNADDLTTDLTGLQIVRDTKANKAKMAALQALKTSVKAVRKSAVDEELIESLRPKGHMDPHPAAGALFLTVLAPLMAVGSMFLMFGVPMLLAGAGAGLGVSAVGSGILGTGIFGYRKNPFLDRRPNKEFMKELAVWLEEDLDRLIAGDGL